ncbi:MAG TPA: tetratricopeptide repeat protein [Dongiaceae bacterium]|nr:tetratricopeptide repeat protein [Dongiaceae bacterium]
MSDLRPARFSAAVLAALVLLLPFAHWSGLADPFALPRSILLAAAALLLVFEAAWSAVLGNASPAAPRRLTFPAAGLLAAAAIAAVMSFNRGLALRGLADLASLAVIAWAASRLAAAPRCGARLLQLAVVPATLVAAGVLAQVFLPGFQIAIGSLSILPPAPAGATFGDAGLAAQWLVLALPLALGAVAMTGGLVRLLAAIGLGTIAAALLYAGGPEAWIIAAIVIVMAIVARVAQALYAGDGWNDLGSMLDGSAFRAAAVAILVVTLVTALAHLPGLVAPTPMTHVSLLAPTSGDPGADRSAAVRGAVAMLELHPAGCGVGNFRHALLEVAWTRVPSSPFTLAHQALHAGNGFLELTAESGAAGGFLFALLVVVALFSAGRAAFGSSEERRPLGLLLALALVAVVLVGSLGSPFQEAAPAALVFLAIGLALPATGAGGRSARRPLGFVALAAAGVLAVASVPWFARRFEIGRAVQAGQARLLADDAAGAIAALDRPSILAAPDHLPQALLGNAWTRQKDYQHAAERFGAVLDRSPWFLAARLGRAAAWQELGRYDRAAADLEAAESIWPHSPGTTMAMARLDEARGRLEQARAGYQSAAALDPSAAEPWVAMGDVDSRRGRYNAALDEYRKAAGINPRQPRINVLIGDSLEKTGYLEIALGFFQKAATVEPASLEARLRLANVLHSLNRDCESRESLQAARELETDQGRRAALDALIDRLETACKAETAAKKP